MENLPTKVEYEVREVEKATALSMVCDYHYSNSLPRLNKYFVGFFYHGDLVGVVTLGYGTRPKHTIQKLFPNMETSDYLEIGRMCMTDDMPRNSESQMLSKLIKWVKANLPNVKVLFTWADGMLGKCGYVYQASNFIYVGYSPTDMYLKDGVKIHPRQTKKLFGKGDNDTRLTCRPTKEQMEQLGIEHWRGNQYRYIFFTCDKREKKRLMKECIVPLNVPPPKDKDLRWTKQNLLNGKWESASFPAYRTDSKQEINEVISL